ncbi:fatty acid desaturase [Xinfangfangia pollutisoli]|uniref:fatty acid desaturase n=1 Tax=Xinfangfangia pollutisoli TaxID=2865960 RepID=UPI001CD37DEC|nr:fatty acid desaturase [Xinfangfangia pollutisoli]
MRDSAFPAGWAEEAPTLALLLASYGLFGLGTTWLWHAQPLLAVLVVGWAAAQFCSLQHEVLHGHPFANRHLNHALVFPALGFFYPYLRFQETHLAHHHDPILTDPYDDPESNYLDPAVWAGLPRGLKALLRVNNTLAGRMLIGPLIGFGFFLGADAALIRRGVPGVARAWLLHLAGIGLVVLWLRAMGGMPVWAWLLACYLAAALLKIRTFLEHRAHELFRARTVVIEDRGPLALLFLNNNFHVVHHMHPAVPWHRLPALYRQNRDHYLRRNEGYLYRNYWQIVRAHLFRAKDPVPHPVWPVARGEAEAPRRAAAE